MPLILGKDGVNRELKEVYIGVGGINKKVNEVYIGQGGVNKQVYKNTITSNKTISLGSTFRIWSFEVEVQGIIASSSITIMLHGVSGEDVKLYKQTDNTVACTISKGYWEKENMLAGFSSHVPFSNVSVLKYVDNNTETYFYLNGIYVAGHSWSGYYEVSSGISANTCTIDFGSGKGIITKLLINDISYL